MHSPDRHPLLDPNVTSSDPTTRRAADQAQSAAQILGDEYVAQRLRDAERDSSSPWALADAAGALAAEAAAASGGGGPSAATTKAIANLYAHTHPEQQAPTIPSPTLETLPGPDAPPAFAPPLWLLHSSMLDDRDIQAVHSPDGDTLNLGLCEALAAPQRTAVETFCVGGQTAEADTPVADLVKALGVAIRAAETLGQSDDPVALGFRKFILYSTAVNAAIVGAMQHQLRLTSAACDWIMSTLRTEGWHEPVSSVPLSEVYAFCSEMSALVPATPDPGTGNEARRLFGVALSQQSSNPAVQPAPPAAEVAAQWAPDPWDRFKLRYWDGAQWTAHVSDGSATGTDPLP